MQEYRDSNDFPQSKVLHFSNLTRMTTIVDIVDAVVSLKLPKPENVLLLPNEQALVEMPTLEYAGRLMDITNRVIYVRGNQARLAYSKSETIHRGKGGERSASHGPPAVLWPEHHGENCILMNIHNPKHEVNVDVLHRILSPHGTVNKIIVFEKNGIIKALVEFDRPEHARNALMAVNGKDIYDGCNHVRIEYSVQKQLNIRHENDKAADYTRARSGAPPPQYDRYSGPPEPRYRSRSPPRDYRDDRRNDYPPPRDPRFDPRDPFDPYERAPMPPMPPMPPMGYDSRDPRRDDFRRDDYRRDDYRRDDRPPQFDPRYERRRSPSPPRRSSWMDIDRAVLFVFNLPSQMNTPDHLFRLFSTYGKVERVRMLPSPGTALVQFINNGHAQCARDFLDSTFAFGNNIRVEYSKHDNVRMTRDPDAKSADYADSELNRFKHKDPPERNLFKPSPVLFFANVPDDTDSKTIYNILVNSGAPRPESLKFFAPGPNSRGGRQGLIGFADTKSAIEALVICNFYMLGNMPMRLSFSAHHIGSDAERFTDASQSQFRQDQSQYRPDISQQYRQEQQQYKDAPQCKPEQQQQYRQEQQQQYRDVPQYKQEQQQPQEQEWADFPTFKQEPATFKQELPPVPEFKQDIPYIQAPVFKTEF